MSDAAPTDPGRAATPEPTPPASVAELTATLRRADYLADRGLATAVFVALSLQRPILLEASPASARPRSQRCSPPCSGAT